MKKEQQLLQISSFCALGIGLMGLSWGVVVHSNAILFDGFYSLLSTLLSFGALYVGRLVLQEEDRVFQFGRNQIEPIFILFRSIVFISLSVYSLVLNTSILLKGGRYIPPEHVLVYAVVALVCSSFVFFKLNSSKKQMYSVVIDVETLQWKTNAFLSACILIVFGAGWLFHDLPLYCKIKYYIDPALVVVLSLLVVGYPLKAFKKNLKELMLIAPNDSLEKEVNRITEELVKHHGFEDYRVRVVRSGRKYFIDVNILVDAAWDIKSVSSLDTIRNQFYHQVDKSGLEPWVGFSFTTQRKWL